MQVNKVGYVGDGLLLKVDCKSMVLKTHDKE
jgi:hypothetical protein